MPFYPRTATNILPEHIPHLNPADDLAPPPRRPRDILYNMGARHLEIFIGRLTTEYATATSR